MTLWLGGCASEDPSADSGDDGGSEVADSSQSGEPTGAQLLTYEGDDREARLLECAEDEPAMRLYTTHTSIDQVTPAFAEDYPTVTPLEVFSAVDPLPQVIIEERSAGAQSFDVFSDATFNFDRTDELFAEFYTPRYDEVREGAKGPLFVANKGFAYSAGYNPEAVSEDELPTSYAEFADPKWAGRIGMGSSYIDRALFGMLYAEFGEEYINNLAKNVVVHNSTPRATSEQVIAGELDVGLPIVASHAAIANSEGAPLRWLPLEPTFVEYTVNSISNEAAAPCTAALWVDWELADDGGQAVYSELGNADPFEGGRIVGGLDYLDEDFAEDLTIIAPDSPELIADFENYQAAQAEWERLHNTFARSAGQ